MLLYLLGSHADVWRSRLRISDDINVFEKKYAYVDQVELKNNGLVLKLNPRSDGKDVKIRLHVVDERKKAILTYEQQRLPPVPPSGGRWLFKGTIIPGRYTVRVELEDCRAFQAQMLYDDDPF